MIEKWLSDWNMTIYDIVKFLFDTGHFYSKEALAVELVHEEDLPRLTLLDRVVMAAVQSYQRWFYRELDQLTMRATEFGGLKRPSIADGEAGENTIELFTMPRCGMPDFTSPEAAVQEANWPDACRNDITTSYRMNLPGLSADELRESWIKADGHWEAAIDVKFRLTDSYPNTRIFAFSQQLPGSVLADQYLAQNNCNARLQGRFDVRQWSAQLFTTTTTHEHGHALGIGHLDNRLATMYPMIHDASMARWGAPHESDISAALQLGYRRRTTPPPPPPPTEEKILTIKLVGDTHSASIVSLQ